VIYVLLFRLGLIQRLEPWILFPLGPATGAVSPCSTPVAFFFDCELTGACAFQAIAFSVLRASTEYISRVKPLTMRLAPTKVPMAQDALDGKGRQIM
jgi:hypothetical protein